MKAQLAKNKTAEHASRLSDGKKFFKVFQSELLKDSKRDKKKRFRVSNILRTVALIKALSDESRSRRKRKLNNSFCEASEKFNFFKTYSIAFKQRDQTILACIQF